MEGVTEGLKDTLTVAAKSHRKSEKISLRINSFVFAATKGFSSFQVENVS